MGCAEGGAILVDHPRCCRLLLWRLGAYLALALYPAPHQTHSPGTVVPPGLHWLHGQQRVPGTRRRSDSLLYPAASRECQHERGAGHGLFRGTYLRWRDHVAVRVCLFALHPHGGLAEANSHRGQCGIHWRIARFLRRGHAAATCSTDLRLVDRPGRAGAFPYTRERHPGSFRRWVAGIAQPERCLDDLCNLAGLVVGRDSEILVCDARV